MPCFRAEWNVLSGCACPGYSRKQAICHPRKRQDYSTTQDGAFAPSSLAWKEHSGTPGHPIWKTCALMPCFRAEWNVLSGCACPGYSRKQAICHPRKRQDYSTTQDGAFAPSSLAWKEHSGTPGHPIWKTCALMPCFRAEWNVLSGCACPGYSRGPGSLLSSRAASLFCNAGWRYRAFQLGMEGTIPGRRSIRF